MSNHEEEETYDDYDDDALGNFLPSTNSYEDEKFKLQRDMLLDEHGTYLVERLQRIPNITPLARTKLYSIITTFYSMKNIVTNYKNRNETGVAFDNLEIAIEELFLSLDVYDTASNDFVVLIELVRAGYYPTVFRARNGFERIQQNTTRMTSEQYLDRQPRYRKDNKFRLRR